MIKDYFFISSLFFVIQISFSQNEKTLRGKVMSGNFLLQNVEVINQTTHKSNTTDIKGEFVLSAKVNDSIVFYSKEYYLKAIKLSLNDIATNNVSVSLAKKPEELDEVIIRQTQKIDLKLLKKWERVKRDEITAERTENRLKTPAIHDGIIDKGLNLARIGQALFALLKKEPNSEKLPQIEFKQLARSSCDEKFYFQTLKLKPDQIELFLEFCDADPKSKTVVESNNVLSLMDFLLVKNIEFRSYETLKN